MYKNLANDASLLGSNQQIPDPNFTSGFCFDEDASLISCASTRCWLPVDSGSISPVTDCYRIAS